MKQASEREALVGLIEACVERADKAGLVRLTTVCDKIEAEKMESQPGPVSESSKERLDRIIEKMNVDEIPAEPDRMIVYVSYADENDNGPTVFEEFIAIPEEAAIDMVRGIRQVVASAVSGRADAPPPAHPEAESTDAPALETAEERAADVDDDLGTAARSEPGKDRVRRLRKQMVVDEIPEPVGVRIEAAFLEEEWMAGGGEMIFSHYISLQDEELVAMAREVQEIIRRAATPRPATTGSTDVAAA